MRHIFTVVRRDKIITYIKRGDQGLDSSAVSVYKICIQVMSRNLKAIENVIRSNEIPLYCVYYNIVKVDPLFVVTSCYDKFIRRYKLLLPVLQYY